MAFGWTGITEGVTKAVVLHMNEVQTNVNTLSDALGIARYGWAHHPLAATTIAQYVHIIELRDAADYVHDNNSCAMENVSNYVPNNSTNNSSYNSTYFADYADFVDNAKPSDKRLKNGIVYL